MKKIGLISLVLVIAVTCMSGCVWTNYKATIKLVNNYTEDVQLYKGVSEDFVVESGGTYTVNPGKAQLIIGQVEPEKYLSKKILLDHDLYAEFDWVVYYVDRNDDEGKPVLKHAPVNGVNDKYKFEFAKKYVITIDKDKNVTIELDE